MQLFGVLRGDYESRKKGDEMNFDGLFCWLRNPIEAARLAGKTATEGIKKFTDKKFNLKLKKVCSAVDLKDSVAMGLYRLAFGDVNEIVKTVLDENSDLSGIMTANLFNVSEVKRVKGGGVEVKFFDRQKALEKLLEISEKNSQENKAESLRLQMTKAVSEIDSEIGKGEEYDK